MLGKVFLKRPTRLMKIIIAVKDKDSFKQRKASPSEVNKREHRLWQVKCRG